MCVAFSVGLAEQACEWHRAAEVIPRFAPCRSGRGAKWTERDFRVSFLLFELRAHYPIPTGALHEQGMWVTPVHFFAIA